MAKKSQPEQKKNGRPSIYTEELGKRICDAVATSSLGLDDLCELNSDFPIPNTIYEWRISNKKFGEMYARAKQNQVEVLVDEIIKIADDTSRDTIIKKNSDGEDYEVCNSEWINRSRLRVDTRKWLAAKLAPRIYGDQKRVEELEGQNDAMRAELRELRATLDAKNKKDY